MKLTFYILFIFLILSCSDISETNSCIDIDCFNGTCAIDDNNNPICICDNGYHLENLSCIKDTQNYCKDIDCSNNGYCHSNNREPECVCDEGYVQKEKKDCILDLCIDVTCSNHGTCIMFADEPICNCEKGYIRAEDKKNCIPEAKTCPPECEEWEECIENKCALKAGFCASNLDCIENQRCTLLHRCIINP